MSEQAGAAGGATGRARWRAARPGWRGARAGRGPLAIVGLTLAVALGADLLASARPIVLSLDGTLHLAPGPGRPAALDGLDADGVSARLGPADWAVWPPVRHDPVGVRTAGALEVLAPPSATHLLGTDDRGRDVLARLVHGARTSALFAVLCALAAAALGLALALLATASRTADRLATLVADAGGALPSVLVVVAVQGLIGGGLIAAALVVALPRAADTGRLIRAALRQALAAPYSEAAAALGLGRARIVVRHALPAAWPALRVATALTAATAVLAEAALGFLGFGAAPPTASWGELIGQAGHAGMPWWLAAPPLVCVTALAVALDALAQPRSGPS